MSQAKIVVVDDDPQMRKFLRILLQTSNYQVMEAPNAVHLVRHLQTNRPDAILLDISMSWSDGFEVCRSLKSNPTFSDIPICIISGRGETRDISKGLHAGASEYFVKPVDSNRLMSWLAGLFA